MKRRSPLTPFFATLLIVSITAANVPGAELDQLPNTQPLTWDGDVAARMVAGVDKFLLNEIEKSVERRAAHWQRDFSSPEAYERSLEPNRRRLAHILGVRDARVPFDAPELITTTTQPALVGKGDTYEVFAVRWPAFRDVHGEGLLLVPTNKEPVANIIAIPDPDLTPEQICGLTKGVPTGSQFARRLAESGCRVIVPVLISREMKKRGPPGQPGRANLTNREYIYRSAFELGRHIIGYEVQKVLACVDWFERDCEIRNPKSEVSNPKIGVIGYGEGGMLALYAAALDTRIDATCVLGYFGPSKDMWREPIDRNVFGVLDEFGPAELATMILPRALYVDNAAVPRVVLPSDGGAPATLIQPDPAFLAAEGTRAERLVPMIAGQRPSRFGYSNIPGIAPHITSGSNMGWLVVAANPKWNWQPGTSGPERHPPNVPDRRPPRRTSSPIDAAARQQRQLYEFDRHNQQLLSESPYVRAEFMKKLDTSSLQKYEESVEWYREYFREEVIGHFDYELLPFNARTRKAYDEEKWTGYEVVLDVWPGVFAYGVLLLPKDLKPGEKRPVVVCQHGLEGRPQDVISGDHRAYHDFAAKLCERGFITFAPQNLYIGKDDFRTLQRKANPLGKTLFSIIVPQHQQIVNWLSTLPGVDPERIAFYGLSYGGKSAMRIPPLVKNYCLSICSADFNEWVLKNASTRAPFSYVWTGEYEIFEFDLGSTFNYAEMAALIAPRPFMVERGHFDSVGTDEWVAYEFAKVRHLYQAKLGIGDRCEIEWFVGPHTINGQGTFDFLHKHLNLVRQLREPGRSK